MEDQERKIVSPSDLLHRQSVRTTFKIGQNCIDMISWLSNHFEITQKEVFDFIFNLEWLEIALERDLSQESEKLHSALTELVNSSAEIAVRKTYVISRGALRKIEQLSKKLTNKTEDKLSRDDILLLSTFEAIAAVLSVIEKQRKIYEKVKEMGEKLAEDLGDILAMLSPNPEEYEDDVDGEFGTADFHLDVALGNINKFLEKYSGSYQQWYSVHNNEKEDE